MQCHGQGEEDDGEVDEPQGIFARLGPRILFAGCDQPWRAIAFYRDIDPSCERFCELCKSWPRREAG